MPQTYPLARPGVYVTNSSFCRVAVLYISIELNILEFFISHLWQRGKLPAFQIERKSSKIEVLPLCCCIEDGGGA
jgi:hypothetical protein